MKSTEESVRKEIEYLDKALEAFFSKKREEPKRVHLKALLVPTKGLKWTREDANAG